MRLNRVRATAGHPLVQSVLSLGTVQFAVIVMPLLTLPYLARVLDQDELGIVVFVQSFSFLIALVVEYGFNLSAPRQVATRSDDPQALAETVAGVYGAKLLLSGVVLGLSLALWPAIGIFRDSPDRLVLGVLLGLMYGFFPLWFFMGIERAQLAAIVEFISRLVALILILMLARDASDGELVILIYLLAATVSTGLLTAIVFRRVRALAPTWRGSLAALRAGRTLFAGTGAIAFYTGANAFLLGLLVSTGQVAIFAAAEKTVRAGNRVLGMMSQAVYPRVSALLARGNVERANRLLVLSLFAFGGAALVGGALMAAGAPVIIDLVFGSGFDDAVPLLRTLALLLPLNVVGVTISTQWLLARERDRRVTGVLLAASVLNAALVILTADPLGLQATAWAIVFVELMVVIGYASAIRRPSAPAPGRGTAPTGEGVAS